MNPFLRKCNCGICRTCKNRDANRLWRDKKRALNPPKPVGRPKKGLDPDKVADYAMRFNDPDSKEVFTLHEIAYECGLSLDRVIKLAEGSLLHVAVSPKRHRAYARRSHETDIARLAAQYTNAEK